VRGQRGFLRLYRDCYCFPPTLTTLLPFLFYDLSVVSSSEPVMPSYDEGLLSKTPNVTKAQLQVGSINNIVVKAKRKTEKTLTDIFVFYYHLLL
jgi:hypothetical protein